MNKWNKFVLGDEYIKETTKRFPKTKEYVRYVCMPDFSTTHFERVEKRLDRGMASTCCIQSTKQKSTNFSP